MIPTLTGPQTLALLRARMAHRERQIPGAPTYDMGVKQPGATQMGYAPQTTTAKVMIGQPYVQEPDGDFAGGYQPEANPEDPPLWSEGGDFGLDASGQPVTIRQDQGDPSTMVNPQGQPGSMGGQPGRARPQKPTFISRDYNFPTPIATPELAAMPQRNLGKEQKTALRAAMRSGVLGLLLGGAQGAAVAAGSTFQGAQQANAQDDAANQQSVASANNAALQKYQLDRGRYQDEMGQNTAQMRLDQQQNQMTNQGYAKELDDYYRYSDLDRKSAHDKLMGELSGERNDIALDRANIAAEHEKNLGVFGLLKSIIDDRRATTGERLAKVQEALGGARVDDIGADNTRADADLKRKVARDAALDRHSKFMEQLGQQRNAISQSIATLRAQGKGPKDLTPVQKNSIIDAITRGQREIAERRFVQSQPDDPDKTPEENKALKQMLEQTIQARRTQLDLLAPQIGWEYNGTEYAPKAPAKPKLGATPISESTSDAMASSSKRNTDGVGHLVKGIQAGVGSPPTGRTPVPQPTPAVVLPKNPPKKVSELSDAEWKKQFAEKLLKGGK